MKPCPSCGYLDEGKSSGIRVYRGKVVQYGGCNFCPRPNRSFDVWVLNGNSLEVRICPDCLKKLKEATK